MKAEPLQDVLNAQHQHWENTFSRKPEMFGSTPSDSAQNAAEMFTQEGKTRILELGGGQGRDTMFFAQRGFHVCVANYCESGVQAIAQKAQESGLSQFITTTCHDIRTQFPFDDATFKGCYSHMFYCMALTTSELEFLSREILAGIEAERAQHLHCQAYSGCTLSDRHSSRIGNGFRSPILNPGPQR